MKKQFKISILLTQLFLLSACQPHNEVKNKVTYLTTKNAHLNLTNYGDKKAPWLKKLHALNRGENVKFRILQIGDSHTAGDYFTDGLRKTLQKKWGNGGIGWIYPSNVSGQRSANIEYHAYNWKTLTSRRDSADFPLGGIISRSNGNGMVELSSRVPTIGEQNITLFIKPVKTNSPLKITDRKGKTTAISNLKAYSWQQTSLKADLPLKYQSQGNDVWEIGYINIENEKPGIVISSMGINGARFTQWDNWHSGLDKDLANTKADLIILAYGTNEAFNNNLDIQDTENYWLYNIRRIKKSLPNAGILIIGAPDSLANKVGVCGEKPIMLNSVQQMQHRIAKKEKLLYWSWADVMNGKQDCNMQIWIAKGLRKKDGVHFTINGYEYSSTKLANDLIKLAQ